MVATLVDALVEWPHIHFPIIMKLITTIHSFASSPVDRPHMQDENPRPRSWHILPFFAAIWKYRHGLRLVDIIRSVEDTKHASQGEKYNQRIKSRSIYHRVRDVETRLVACGIFSKVQVDQYFVDYFEPGNVISKPSALAREMQMQDWRIPDIYAWL